MGEIEQRRRDLKGSDPELYAYISRMERAKELDRAGDIISGFGNAEGANWLWSTSAELNENNNSQTENNDVG